MIKKIDGASKKEIKNLGIWLIIFGAIHIFASGLLSFYWGFILIILGIFSLISKKLIVFLLFGIVITVAGLLNLFSSLIETLLIEEGLLNYFWLIFGGFQIYWGITTIIRYSKIKK